MPREVATMDYSKLIEVLTALDTDQDFCLTKDQFYTLLTNHPISQRDGFNDVVYHGLRERKTGLVGFQAIRVLYEATRIDFINKPMLLIMFRGVTEKHAKVVNLTQYLTIARLTQTNYNEDIFKEKFDYYDQTKKGEVTYANVALSLFGIRVKTNENPYKEPVEIVSPHSACCRI